MLLLLVLLLLLVKRGIAPPLYTHFYTSNSKSDRVRSLFFVRLICYFSTLCARCCWICDFFECTIFHFSSAGTHCFFDVYVVVASLSVCLCVIDLNVYSRSLLFSPFFFSLVCQLLSQFYHANKCFSGDFSLSLTNSLSVVRFGFFGFATHQKLDIAFGFSYFAYCIYIWRTYTVVGAVLSWVWEKFILFTFRFRYYSK